MAKKTLLTQIKELEGMYPKSYPLTARVILPDGREAYVLGKWFIGYKDHSGWSVQGSSLLEPATIANCERLGIKSAHFDPTGNLKVVGWE